jgi:SAM-dependent methyltransferase
LKGFEVIWSDLENPESTAKGLHKEHHDLSIRYAAINATEIPYEEEFDIIVFKSILGGISRNGHDELKKEVIDQIYKALKKGGQLLFAENLQASSVHQFFRKKFVKWGAEWNYLRAEEIDPLFADFSHFEYQSKGFLAAFGRSESQRKLLGKIDGTLDPLLSTQQHYLVFGVATK